jgi:hypothetical protein
MRSPRKCEDIEAFVGKSRPELAPDPCGVSKSGKQNHRRSFPWKVQELKACAICSDEATLNAWDIYDQRRRDGRYDWNRGNCCCLTVQSCGGNCNQQPDR